MAAVGFGMVAVGAMLVYAGMTGDSLPGAIRDVVQGRKSSSSSRGTAGGGWGSSGATSSGTGGGW